MDDYEHPKVQRLRAPRTLFDKRYARGRCPQCGKKRDVGQLYCGAACSQEAEMGRPMAPETDEEKSGAL